MEEFNVFKNDALSKFRAAKHPNDLLKNAIFVEHIKKWYEHIFHVTPKINGCGVCLYEIFKEMTDLQEKQLIERLNLPKLIKPGVVVFVGTTPYSRKSPHLTAEILAQIPAHHLEDNPNFVEEKPKRTRKKKSEDGDNSQSK